jgi:hypothetical protein
VEIVDGDFLVNQSVELDGKQFVNCSFLNCILEYHGGEIAFDRTKMNGCWHVFFGRSFRL